MKNLYPVISGSNSSSNDCLVVRVWKSKKRNGSVATDAMESIYEDGAVGHASLQLFRNNQEILYMSFWPTRTAKQPFEMVKPQLQSLELDNKKEGGFADVRVYLFDFNVNNIHEECKKFFTRIPKWALLPNYNGTKIQRIILGKSHNCCTTVFSIVTHNNCLGPLGTKSSLIQSHIDGLNKKYIQPNDLAEFFLYWNDYEKKSSSSYVDLEKKFHKDVQRKFLDYACKKDMGSMTAFRKKHPEAYEQLDSLELLKKTPELVSRLEAGDQNAAEELKIMQLSIEDIGDVAGSALQKSKSDKEKALDLMSDLKKVNSNLRAAAAKSLGEFSAYQELFIRDIISAALYDPAEKVKQAAMATLKKIFPPPPKLSTLCYQQSIFAMKSDTETQKFAKIYPTIS